MNCWKVFLADSDAALVRKVLDDRPEAFEELVLRYQTKAHAIARAFGVPARRRRRGGQNRAAGGSRGRCGFECGPGCDVGETAVDLRPGDGRLREGDRRGTRHRAAGAGVGCDGHARRGRPRGP